jgi:hypothetical protein
MKVMKIFGLLCVLILATFMAQNTYGGYLSTSTYGTNNGWDGYTTYTSDGISLKVYFNVYDTEAYPDEFTWPSDAGVDMSSTDRYIYVYEVFNLTGGDDIASFSVLTADGGSLDTSLLNGTCSTEDNAGTGISTDPTVSTTQGIWQWSSSGGYLGADEHSWYLIYSSAYAPTKGSVTATVSSSSDTPVPEVPEPASIILFGSAVGWIMTRRNNKRRSS